MTPEQKQLLVQSEIDHNQFHEETGSPTSWKTCMICLRQALLDQSEAERKRLQRERDHAVELLVRLDVGDCISPASRDGDVGQKMKSFLAIHAPDRWRSNYPLKYTGSEAKAVLDGEGEDERI